GAARRGVRNGVRVKSKSACDFVPAVAAACRAPPAECRAATTVVLRPVTWSGDMRHLDPRQRSFVLPGHGYPCASLPRQGSPIGSPEAEPHTEVGSDCFAPTSKRSPASSDPARPSPKDFLPALALALRWRRKRTEAGPATIASVTGAC